MQNKCAVAPEHNPYYPYEKIQEYATLPDADAFLQKVVRYLLDLPENGYNPPDNNDFPRCRINKLLYWDGEDALEKPLPTPQQKLSLVFNPKSPDVPPDKEKKYRVYPMIYPVQAQSVGQTTLKIVMGWAKPTASYRVDQSVLFEVMTNTAYEGNVTSDALSRTYAICTDIIRALNGVNIDGVGTFYFDRRQHTECTLEPIADKAENVGYRLVLGVSFIGGEGK
jgi:hypothetical protein